VLAACSPALRFDQVAERAAFYAAIERPFYLAWGLSVVAALAWLAIMRRRRVTQWSARCLAVTLVVLAVAQPAWWMESMRGDCGMARDSAAIVVAASSMLLLALGAWRQRVAGASAPEAGIDARGA